VILLSKSREQRVQQRIITPFSLRYEGGLADDHVIDTQQLGLSLIGSTKFYSSVVHYCLSGKVPRGNYRKEYGCYAQASQQGGYGQWLFVAPLALQHGILAEGAKEAVSYIFFKTVSVVKNIMVRESQTEKIVAEFCETLRHKAEGDKQVMLAAMQLVGDANEQLSSLQGKMIDTLPYLAAANRQNARDMVAPVGQSCNQFRQFSRTPFEDIISEPEAEVIKSRDKEEIEDMQTFTCISITEVNKVTGHCEMLVDGLEKPIKGKITDPVLMEPGNVYTRALDRNTSFRFSAKPVTKNGEIHRLYISDANDQ